jgi:hypothetical protein
MQQEIKMKFGLSVLSVIYLLFELAFNARLLDVVGGGASLDEIHDIEFWGRLLSGTAVALVVLGICWKRGYSFMRTSIFFCLTVVLVFHTLVTITDWVVKSRNAEFRRNALDMLLVQEALVQGRAELKGLDDDPAIFSKPEGKSFLAVFPVIATASAGLTERIADIKEKLIRQSLDTKAGGPRTLYSAWEKARGETQERWKRYSKFSTPKIDTEIRSHQDKAWNDYLRSLGRHGWTPSTVPRHAQVSVVRKVRQDLRTLPADWATDDEIEFRDAVERKVRSRFKNVGDGSIVVNNQRIPPGLGFDTFFRHPAIQTELTKQLHLPAGTAIRSDYESAKQFEQEIYEVWLRQQVHQTLKKYVAPIETFEANGSNAALGADAARSVIIPPLALFFSLTGALFHIGKLTYLFLSMILKPASQSLLLLVTLPPIGVVFTLAVFLSLQENPVTRSRVYALLHEHIQLQQQDASRYYWLGLEAFRRTTHLVAVGQSYAYPMNEFIRTRILRGITYGYPDRTK